MNATQDARSKAMEAKLSEMRKDPVRYYARVRKEEARKYRGFRSLRALRSRERTA